MKWTGLGTLALAAVVAIGCERNTANDRDDVRDDRDARETTGTAGDDIGGDADDRGFGDLGLGAAPDSREFVREVSMVGHAEVQLAQLAAQRAQSADVKQFAQMMIRDHTKASNELKQAVSRHNVSMAEHVDDKHQSLMDRLKTLRGAEFDREYMAAMVEGHRDARDLIGSRADDRRTTGTSGNRADNRDEALDNAVNQWAAKALPTVDQHLRRAEEIRDTLSGTRATSTTQGSKNY
jgi:putative membrane protein